MKDPKEMTTLQLDEASATILGYKGMVRKDGFYYIERRKVKGMLKKWNPTGDITQAWPIIVDNHIDIINPRPYLDNKWHCQLIGKSLTDVMEWCEGTNPLVEAIRVFVIKNIEKFNEN